MKLNGVKTKQLMFAVLAESGDGTVHEAALFFDHDDAVRYSYGMDEPNTVVAVREFCFSAADGEYSIEREAV